MLRAPGTFSGIEFFPITALISFHRLLPQTGMRVFGHYEFAETLRRLACPASSILSGREILIAVGREFRLSPITCIAFRLRPSTTRHCCGLPVCLKSTRAISADILHFPARVLVIRRQGPVTGCASYLSMAGANLDVVDSVATRRGSCFRKWRIHASPTH